MKQEKQLIRQFRKLYDAKPGVIKIEYDEILEDNIVVFVDNKKFKLSTLPPEYEGFDIITYDVRDVMKNSQAMLQRMKDEEADMSDPNNKRGYAYLTEAVKICEKLLSKESSNE